MATRFPTRSRALANRFPGAETSAAVGPVAGRSPRGHEFHRQSARLPEQKPSDVSRPELGIARRDGRRYRARIGEYQDLRLDPVPPEEATRVGVERQRCGLERRGGDRNRLELPGGRRAAPPAATERATSAMAAPSAAMAVNPLRLVLTARTTLATTIPLCRVRDKRRLFMRDIEAPGSTARRRRSGSPRQPRRAGRSALACAGCARAWGR